MAWALQTGDREFIRQQTDPFDYLPNKPKELFYAGGYPEDAVNVPDERFTDEMIFAFSFKTKQEAESFRDSLASNYKVKFHTIPL